MTAGVGVLVVGVVLAVVTERRADLDMWTPLIVALTPLIAYMTWPRRA